MGKFMDFILADNWEEYQRIQLFKKVGNKIENLSSNDLKELNSGRKR